MRLISKTPSQNGAYPPIQDCELRSVPEGVALWPETLPTGDFYACNGFVTLTVEDVDGVPTVTGCVPNVEAWEEWKASLPEPEPEAPGEIEQLRTEVAALSARAAPVMAAATAYAQTATDISDTIALDMAELFPTWEDALEAGTELPAGRILSDGGRLYRVVQAVTPQAHQAPHDEGMLAIYRPIDRDHAGTADDPIPWVYGIDCYTGLYYSYAGSVYLCKGDMKPCVWAPDTAGMWQWEAV